MTFIFKNKNTAARKTAGVLYPLLCFDGGMTSYLISKQHHKGEMKVVINTKMRLAEVVKGELEKEYSQLYLL